MIELSWASLLILCGGLAIIGGCIGFLIGATLGAAPPGSPPGLPISTTPGPVLPKWLIEHPKFELNPAVADLPCLYNPSWRVRDCEHFLCADYNVRRSDLSPDTQQGDPVRLARPPAGCVQRPTCNDAPGLPSGFERSASETRGSARRPITEAGPR